MNIVVRLLAGAGIFLLGYYVGRQVSLSEFVRKDLESKRENLSHDRVS